MKNKSLIILYYLIIVSTKIVSAQDFKGRWIIGSNLLNVGSSKTETNFTLTPNFGKYITNKTGLGAIADISYNKKDGEQSLFNWSAGPYIKIYFLMFNNKNYLFTREKILYGQSEVLTVSTKEKKIVNDNFTSEGISIGYTTALHEHLSLEFEPGIAFTQKNNKTNTGYTFSIGFEYRFGVL